MKPDAPSAVAVAIASAAPPAAGSRAASTSRAAALSAAALAWFEANGRGLAFRRSSEPWSVLVSEVMAQQTQAARAAEAWAVFVDRYRTPSALAAASNADVIRAWRGLGYNRRAVALRAAAVRIVEEHGGVVPDSIEALVALPGIGPYTARAVLAIAFSRPTAALDTNIQRVLDRAVGPLPSSRVARQAAADGCVPFDRPSTWTHALMDIGATICRKREPRCDVCPLQRHCRFAQEDRAPAELAARPPAGRAPARGAPPTPPALTGAARRAAAAPVRFESTTRWLRGRILDRLRDAEDGAWIDFQAPLGSHGLAAVHAALLALAREGLVELQGEIRERARLLA